VTAHSCVENKHGELVDITPTQASQDYRSYDTLARTRSFLPWRTPSIWMSPWGESPTIRSSWFPVGALGFVAGVANGHDQVGDNVVVDCNVGVCAHGILQDVRQHPRLRYGKAVSLVGQFDDDGGQPAGRRRDGADLEPELAPRRHVAHGLHEALHAVHHRALVDAHAMRRRNGAGPAKEFRAHALRRGYKLRVEHDLQRFLVCRMPELEIVAEDRDMAALAADRRFVWRRCAGVVPGVSVERCTAGRALERARAVNVGHCRLRVCLPETGNSLPTAVDPAD